MRMEDMSTELHEAREVAQTSQRILTIWKDSEVLSHVFKQVNDELR
jgi:hypothetical protein